MHLAIKIIFRCRLGREFRMPYSIKSMKINFLILTSLFIL